MAVTGHGVHVGRTDARVADVSADVVDGGVHRHRQLRRGRARGLADGPDRAQVRRHRVRTAHVRRMDVHNFWPTSEYIYSVIKMCRAHNIIFHTSTFAITRHCRLVYRRNLKLNYFAREFLSLYFVHNIIIIIIIYRMTGRALAIYPVCDGDQSLFQTFYPRERGSK